ncbi:NAD-binding protein [Fomitiporia mediterranea MF3/22]|uniref:Arsenite methyltransferase n=1 Tax=Fomitiporia mediterranea (strain MF3/22) TaxID=694068 RepID=R7SGW7_FOMME|nr:NAD-binding protein [Fomitiporia mediterranea MF3/22]EJC97655.1 NAD-binding protein [Fomitiporia mediterranea MF3/22]
MSMETEVLVQGRYGLHAKENESEDYSKYNTLVASAFGYTAEELSSLPLTANLGLSCGNPLTIAHIKPGETTIDLGSGGGLDVFLAAKKVGPTGKSIGIDMTDEMIDLARRNAENDGYANVEFIKSNIISIPIPSSTAHVIMSNCVINLVPEVQKPLVFCEIFRLLVPGGRVSISDILAKRPLPEEIKEDASLYIGCVSGASLVTEYDQWMRDAGFSDITIVNTNKDLNIYKDGILQVGSDSNSGNTPKNSAIAGCCATTQKISTCATDEKSGVKGCCASTSTKVGPVDNKKEMIRDINLNEFVGSYQIYAVKPVNIQSA